MFDIGATELLLVAIVALLVIGPKDLPLAMRTAGRWMGQIRGMTKHVRVGIDAMIRDAEVEEQEKEWAARNEEIMRDNPDGVPEGEADGETASEPSLANEMKPLPKSNPDSDQQDGAPAKSSTDESPAALPPVDPAPAAKDVPPGDGADDAPADRGGDDRR